MSLFTLDITRHAGMLIIHLPHSKTDQLRKGDEVVIARTGNSTCPVAMLEIYMSRTSTAWDEKRQLFRSICRTGKCEKLRESSSFAVRELDYDPGRFGLHSLCGSGATAAANNGVPNRLFKKHGCWKSDSAKDEDSVKQRLTVSPLIIEINIIHTTID